MKPEFIKAIPMVETRLELLVSGRNAIQDVIEKHSDRLSFHEEASLNDVADVLDRQINWYADTIDGAKELIEAIDSEDDA